MTSSSFSSMIDPSTSSLTYEESQMQMNRPQGGIQQIIDKRQFMQMSSIPQNTNQQSRTFYSQRANAGTMKDPQLNNFQIFDGREGIYSWFII